MMNKRSSTRIYERLMRQAIVNGRTAIQTGHGNTASSRKALSFMGWANLLIDREGDDANPPPTGRNRRMGNSGKGTGATSTPASDQEKQPSPANGRPVLRVVSADYNGRQSVRTNVRKPCLTLIMGGKA